MSQLFYMPQKAAVGDVIPFYAEGEFKIFYLNLGRSPWNAGALPDWHLLGTQDFVHYKEYGSTGIREGPEPFSKSTMSTICSHAFSRITGRSLVTPQVAIF